MFSTARRSACSNGGWRSIAALTSEKTMVAPAMPSVSEPMAAKVRSGALARLRNAYRRSDAVLTPPPVMASAHELRGTTDCPGNTGTESGEGRRQPRGGMASTYLRCRDATPKPERSAVGYAVRFRTVPPSDQPVSGRTDLPHTIHMFARSINRRGQPPLQHDADRPSIEPPCVNTSTSGLLQRRSDEELKPAGSPRSLVEQFINSAPA